MVFFKRKERHEKILIELTFKEGQLNKANKRILEEYIGKSLDKVWSSLTKDDTISTEYYLNIDYYNVVERLKLLLILLDTPDIITKMDIKEIKYGKSLLFELASKLEEVENKLKN